MINRDLINLLLDYPMDVEIVLGIPKDNEEDLMDCYGINAAMLGEVNEDEVIILHYEELTIDPSLN